MPYADVVTALEGAGIAVAVDANLELYRGKTTALVSTGGWVQQPEGRLLPIWEVALSTLLTRGIVTHLEGKLVTESIKAAAALQEAGFVLRGNANRFRMDMGNKAALVGLRFIVLEYG